MDKLRGNLLADTEQLVYQYFAHQSPQITLPQANIFLHKMSYCSER